MQFGAQPTLFILGTDQRIDSLNKVPSSGNEVGYLVHEELDQHPASSISRLSNSRGASILL